MGNNTPVFFVRDAMKFPHFIRTQKRQPDSGLQDWNMRWDFWTLQPESAHQVTYLMGDRGIPKSWRHMNGYGSHTYMWVNEAGERSWVKYHFESDQGVVNLPNEEGAQAAATDPEAHRRDLFYSIADGEFPQLDALRPGDAVRGREDVPLQPLRPDQDLVEEGLPADQGRHHDPGPQPGELLRPDRAGRLRAQHAWSPASASAPTRCCSAGSSPTPTPTATASARTTCSCR